MTGSRTIRPVPFILSIPETITTDPTRLRQTLINLVGNAVKFTELAVKFTELGEIGILTSLVENPAGDPKLQFQIIDSGIGMTEQQMARLFTPFSQSGSFPTSKV